MRAKDVIQVLFSQIVELTGSTVEEIEIYKGCIVRVITVVSEKVIVGLRQESFDEGVRTYLNIWEFPFDEGYEPVDIRRRVSDGPDFQLIGGPFSGGIWAKDQGRLLVERIEIKSGASLFFTGIPISRPIIPFITLVLMFAIATNEIIPPTMLRYWEAFPKPDADYTEPPK